MIKAKIYSCCLILSATILGANVTVVSAQNIKNTQAIEAKSFINSVNRAEQVYYLELKKFTNNLQDLQLTPPSDSYEYKLNIINNKNLIQTVATPRKTERLKTFTGALSLNDGNFSSILCRSKKYGQVIVGQIKLVENQLQCPPGFKITFHQVQQEAINSIGAINRAQQANFLETQNFTNNQQELRYIPSNTYFDYTLALIKNGALAQAIATPRFDNLKTYVGGIFFAKDPNSFQSIVCASNKPTKNITQSIKLVNNQLYCPTGFKIPAPETK